MTSAIRLEATYPHPPEKVWRVLTDPAALAKWLMPNDFEPTLGRKFQFRSKPMPGWRGFVDCEVLELVPLKTLVYSWLGDADWSEPSVVRWTLEPDGTGTRLILEHTNLQEPWGSQFKSMFEQGWGKMVRVKLLQVLNEEEMSR